MAALIAGVTATPAKAVSFAAGQPAYLVADRKTELQQQSVHRLADYLTKVVGQPTRIVPRLAEVPAQTSAIILADEGQARTLGLSVPQENAESFALETRELDGRAVVIATGHTDRGLKRAVQRLILKSEQQPSGLVIPELKISESPWIARREYTLCGWGPQLIRGIWQNPQADKRLNIWVYSEQQVADYVAMFDAFGFSGSQLMDTVANYAVVGSAEAFQGQLKTFARALRANGQDVSLWVWAAQFDDFGWFDREITYKPEKGKTLFEDPKVRAGFERYYDGYAQLAPEVDLLIAHFYDPGMLKNREDVFNYMRLLVDKFKAKNPRVQLGIDFWYADKEAEYMQQLIEHGFKDVLFLENTMPHTYPPGRREALHEEAKRRGLKMGVWGWHTAEIETDQNPNMHVNAKLLSHFYRQVKNGVHQIHPLTYWSEMEAYHLNNIFTMYAAGQLLWNPDRDPDEILREIAEGIWGPRNGARVLAALHLIQDVRTGPTWDTYWIWLPTHRLGTPEPAEDLRRANEAIAAFESMTTDPTFVPKFPLPFPPATFIELTLPHLRQIKQFAEFRIKFAALQRAAKDGASKAELTKQAHAAWDPIREYSNWIGMFGPLEAATQEKMLMQFGREHGLEIKPPGWMRFRDANRQLQAIQTKQRELATPWVFKANSPLLWKQFLWPEEKGRDRLQFLLETDAVKKVGDDTYQLANWEEYRRR